MSRFFQALFVFLILSASSGAQTIGGVGAQLFMDTTGGHTMPRIQSLVPRTPAYDSLKATDYIIKVNDVDCGDKTMEQVVMLIRGEVGTIVKITVADTKEGKRPREYELPRVAIQLAPPVDPAAAFYNDCNAEVRQLRHRKATIIKTYSSECGNYFFNFDADTEPCHVRIMTLETRGTVAFSPSFTPTAKVFDNADEAAATEIPKSAPRQSDNMYITVLEKQVSFKKPCVATISLNIHDDISRCKGMFIVVYK